MGEQLGRDYLLKIGPAGGAGREFRPPGDITFEVEQGITKGIDKAKITLYNVSPDDTDFLLQRGLRVILAAGYEADGIGTIFQGQIAQRGVRATSVVTRRETTDFIVEIEAGTGEIDLQQGRFDKSYAPGITNLQIITEIAATLNLQLLGRELIPRQEYQTGWAHSGTITEALQELADSIGSSWSVNGDALLMLDRAGVLSERAVVVAPETGLIGDAIRGVDGTDFTSRMNYRIRPGRKVKLRAPGVRSGIYKINRLKHIGELRGGRWDTECFSRYTGGGA